MILILGLLGGILLPEPAIFLQKYLPVLVVLLLFVAALRIGPRNLVSNKETFSIDILSVKKAYFKQFVNILFKFKNHYNFFCK